MKTQSKLIILIVILFQVTINSQSKWRSLFNGKDLTGWEVLNGYAKYFVEDGILVGEAVVGSPNSFLCTKAKYSDFILEFETKTDPELNTG
ncbi:MAG: DUF1080 domain-containing protein, partial [Ignavibacteria bacterium]|nr:DUF1080 domain-containing protein [Ignavibacteria bacterium]